MDDYSTRFGEDQHWQWGHIRWLAANGASTKSLLSNRSVVRIVHWKPYVRPYFAVGDYASALDAAQTLCQSAPGEQYFSPVGNSAPLFGAISRQSALTAVNKLILRPTRRSLVVILEQLNTGVQVAEALIRHHSMRSAPAVSTGRHTNTGEFTCTDIRTTPFESTRGNSIYSHIALCVISTHRTPEAHPIKLFRPRQPMMHAKLGDSRKGRHVPSLPCPQ